MLTLSLILTGCFGCSQDLDLDEDGFSPEDGDCDEGNPSVYPGADETWYDGIDQDCDGNDGDKDGDGFVPDHYVIEVPDWADFPEHVGSGDCWDDPDIVPPGWVVGGISQQSTCGAGGADLVAGQHIDVGEVVFENDEDTLRVVFRTEGDWEIQEVHVDVGCTILDIPSRHGNPVPGQFPWSQTGLSTNEVTVEVPLSQVSCVDSCDDRVVVAAHAKVVDTATGQDETAWGAGLPTPGNNWATFSPYDLECCDGLPIDAIDVYPGADDIPGDGIDADCDGESDNDQDGDGYDDQDSGGDDCDDTDPNINPGATEACNGVDDDCDGLIDEVDADGCTELFLDEDGDGFGLGVDSLCLCEPDGDHRAEEPGDCDDANPDINPDGVEVCDGADNDCDGGVDNDAVDAPTWYIDGDGDGIGSVEVRSCDQPGDGVTEGGDCDDSDATVFPGSASTETPNDGIDQDCDGNDFCTDMDCDGIGDVVVTSFYDSVAQTYVGHGRVYSGASGWQDYDAFNVEGGHRLLVEDLDGDGYQDIVVANHFDNSSFVINSFIYWGSAGQYTANNRTKLPTSAAAWAATGDFNGDGYTDLAFSNHHDNSSYVVDSIVFYGNGGRIDGQAFTDLPTLGAYELLAEDLDGDGYDDLVFANSGDDSSYEVDSVVYWGSSTGLSTGNTTELPTTGAFSVDAGDVNGDGYTDLAFSSYIDDNGDYSLDSLVYLGSASGYDLGDVVTLESVGAYWVRVQDLDGDGYEDLVLPSYYDGGFSLDSHVYYGSASGPGAVTELATKGAMEPLIVDLDQDGWTDIVFSNARSNSSYAVDSVVYWGSANGFSGSNKTGLETTGAHGAGASDLDGDGYLDLVFSNYLGSTGTRQDSLIYWGSSNGWSEGDRTELPTIGNYAAPVLVP